MSLVAWGCASGVEGDEDDDGSGGSAPPSKTYSFRAPLDLGLATEGDSVRLSFRHADLVDEEKAQDDGDDVRVFFEGDEGPVELDRFLEPSSSWDSFNTTIWFQAQPGDGIYYLYYGAPDAADPPADPTQIFELYETFDGDAHDEGWSFDAVGPMATANEATVGAGELALRGKGADIGGTSDDFVFFHRSLSGDFALDIAVAKEVGSGGFAKLGGVMMREGLGAGARFASVLLRNNADPSQRKFLSMQRLANDTLVETTESGAGGGFPYHMRLVRVAGATRAQYSVDGINYVDVGTPVNLGVVDPVMVGIPYSNGSGSPTTLFLDWIRVRRGPDNLALLGDEEEL